MGKDECYELLRTVRKTKHLYKKPLREPTQTSLVVLQSFGLNPLHPLWLLCPLAGVSDEGTDPEEPPGACQREQEQRNWQDGQSE